MYFVLVVVIATTAADVIMNWGHLFNNLTGPWKLNKMIIIFLGISVVVCLFVCWCCKSGENGIYFGLIDR